MQRDLNDTLVFVKVVELGSFTAAAKALQLPNTTVSRKVRDLETRLGAQLLHRTTRKLGLTEAGTVYFEHCQRIARELDQAEGAVAELQSGPRGWLRVTTTHGLGATWIAPLLGEFHARHPQVRVELLLSNDHLDIIAGEIDVAIRVGTLADSNLLARRLSVLRAAVYTTPSYIERFGEPLHPDDLIHRQVDFSVERFQRKARFLERALVLVAAFELDDVEQLAAEDFDVADETIAGREVDDDLANLARDSPHEL